jgi:gliding motility-associated lipoprotein GldH
MKLFVHVLLLLSGSILFSCTDPAIIAESKIDTPDNYWAQKASMDFPFEITDTQSTYKVFYQIRYDNDYPYYNLWVNRILLDEKGNTISKKLQGMDLFHAASGEPYGAGFGNYFDYKILSDSTHRFLKAGKYTLRIEQNMRTDTLKGISSVGIEIMQNLKQ